MSLVDWIGSVGVGMLLLAFALNLSHRLKADSLAYRLLNFAGACLACYASALIEYPPFIVLEGVWALVALVALVRPPVVA